MAEDGDDDALKKHRDLLIACGWGKEVDVILLLQQGASVRVQDQDGKNCLHYASCKGHIQVTKLLVESGCTIDAKDKTLRTPLHLASEEGHHDIVSILLDNNALYNEQDEEGNTPLHVASLNDHTDVIELLIHIKADLNIKNKDGFTPLHVATMNNHTRSIALLMKSGVNKSAQDLCGNAAVHLAANIRSLKALRCLIKHGADINVQNHEGNSALHICCDNGSKQLVQLILNSDQPIELSNNNVGDTAKDIAIRHGYREIALAIPDPKKKKSKTRSHHSESPVSPASRNSAGTPPHEKPSKSSPRHKPSRENSLRMTSEYRDHVDRSGNATSMSSLWIPTTDSGISLPMDYKAERRNQARHRHKRPDKNDIFDELRKYDSHKKSDPQKSKHHHSRRKDKYLTHEYEELKYDPIFMSPLVAKRNISGPPDSYSSNRTSGNFFDSGTLSDESMQVSGCFFKTNKKKSGKKSPTKEKCRNLYGHDDDELLHQRKVDLYYDNLSKHSLEKQMRDMRRKFQKILLATDERFLEQKKREEAYHSQIKYELEHIEKSLGRSSKTNVDEYTEHIRSELGRLAEKIGHRGFDMSFSDQTDNSDNAPKVNKRVSAVDLDRQISVSLMDNFNGFINKPKLAKNTKDKKEKSSKQKSIMQLYETRLQELEKEAKEKEQKEKENEALKARVAELEKLVKATQENGET